MRYCGRDFTPAELDAIRALIAAAPGASRAALSHQVCRSLGWAKPDGAPKAMSCRVAMLRMHADGLIPLPPPRHRVRRLPHDWAARYAYRPLLLETFVDAHRYPGTCYRAANWVHVGTTQGRGKLDRNHTARLPRKDIWLYPLVPGFRSLLSS